MTSSSLKIRCMYLKVHAWHLVLATGCLYKLIDVGLCHVVRTLQYLIEVIIVVEEFWVLLMDEVKEVFTIHFTGVGIYIVEILGLHNFYSWHLPTLYRNGLVFLVLVHHSLYNFGLLTIFILDLFLLLNLWHFDNDNCLLVSVLLVLNLDFLHRWLSSFSWWLRFGSFGRCLHWLHNLLDRVFGVCSLRNLDENDFAHDLIELHIRRLDRHLLR